MSDELKPYHFKENSIPSEFRDSACNPDCFEAFSVKEVQRKLAGYEKREQNLKNKIKEQALRIRKTLNSFEDLTNSFHYSDIQGAQTVEGFNYSDLKAQLEERERELLGLSKQ